MNPADAHAPAPAPPPATGWHAWLRKGENLLPVLALAAMVILPLLEIPLRKLFKSGIPGVNTIVQHLTLVIGMLGGALAARDNRLLAMSALPTILKGRWKTAAAVFSGSVAATVALFLTVAGWKFVLSERESGNFLLGQLPIWWVQLIMPLGFGLVAWRLVRNAADNWPIRALVFALSGALVWFALHPPLDAAKLVVPAIVALLAATALGAPVFVTLGGAALILFWGDDSPIASVSLDHYRLVTNPTLPTIPLFTLAGYMLAEGEASRRLVHLFQAFFGCFRGGPAIVTALLCAFFTSFTGASGVTILALGGLLMPVMIAARYSERSALGLLTGAGGLGLLFPPSLPLILFAIIAGSKAQASGVTIQNMFLAGLGPGCLLVAMTAWWGMRQGPQDAAERPKFNGADALLALKEAKWELMVPVVALVALFGGFAAPVEAAAVTALYVFIVAVFVHKDLHWLTDVPRVLTECGLLVGGVLMILGVALGLTNYLVDAQIPVHAVEWVTGAIKSKYAFLLALNILLLLVGCFMDTYSAIVVVVPLLVPLGAAYGIDPLHLGIIFLANMELGLLAPTVGINIFLASYRFKKPVMEITRAVLPMQLVLLTGVLLITYLPFLSTWLPKLLGK